MGACVCVCGSVRQSGYVCPKNGVRELFYITSSSVHMPQSVCVCVCVSAGINTINGILQNGRTTSWHNTLMLLPLFCPMQFCWRRRYKLPWNWMWTLLIRSNSLMFSHFDSCELFPICLLLVLYDNQTPTDPSSPKCHSMLALNVISGEVFFPAVAEGDW